ncbi:MAG: hypothetical protein H6553_03910 [Chitinophagales bacterium]|nr:hypothetical protein [Chitinophagales bacterium]
MKTIFYLVLAVFLIIACEEPTDTGYSSIYHIYENKSSVPIVILYKNNNGSFLDIDIANNEEKEYLAIKGMIVYIAFDTAYIYFNNEKQLVYNAYNSNGTNGNRSIFDEQNNFTKETITINGKEETAYRYIITEADYAAADSIP